MIQAKGDDFFALGIDHHNTAEGPVALLGAGPSVKKVNLSSLRSWMPFIGINDSWRFWSEPIPRVFIDWDLQAGPAPEYAVYPESGEVRARGLPYDCAMIPIRWRVRVLPRVQSFSFNLKNGTDAAFGGMFALEWAVWKGYNPIILIGYDCLGGHCYDDKKIPPGKTMDFWRHHTQLSVDACRERGVNVFR